MRSILLTATLLISTVVFSQHHGAIKGKIMDNQLVNEPLPFANVRIKDTSWKTRTNLNGNFEIADVDPGTYTLVIGFVGYEKLELLVEVKKNGTTEIHKGLEAKSISIGEVVTTDGKPKKIIGSVVAEKGGGQK